MKTSATGYNTDSYKDLPFNAKKVRIDQWIKKKNEQVARLRKETEQLKAKVEPMGQEVAKRSTALVRPGDITDAVDSSDLLDTLLAQNLAKIQTGVDKRIVSEWVSTEKSRLKDGYLTRARIAYEKMWDTCGSSSVSHNYKRIEALGENVNECVDCCFHTHYSTSTSGVPHSTQVTRANDMNRDMIKAMAERMIEVDIDAEKFAWPTPDDYPNIRGATKKRGLFSK